MSDCIGEPVSWLRLERYQLGELSDAEQGAVAQHVANCPACGACLQRIEQPIALAPLPLMAAKPKRMFAWSGSVALAAAAAIGLALWRGITPEPSRPAARMRTKGGEFALELVRMDADGRQQTPTHFRAGDRFKVLLTSASEFHGWADVVVFQDGRAYFPIDRAPLEGGNRRTLPGAFQLDGAAVVDVCAVWSESAIDRTQLERGVDALPKPSACVRLDAAR